MCGGQEQLEELKKSEPKGFSLDEVVSIRDAARAYVKSASKDSQSTFLRIQGDFERFGNAEKGKLFGNESSASTLWGMHLLLTCTTVEILAKSLSKSACELPDGTTLFFKPMATVCAKLVQK